MNTIRNLTICIFFFFPNVSYAATAPDNKTVPWPQLRTAFEAYANYPTSANATKVIALLPKTANIKYSGEPQEQDTLKFMYDAYQIRMLERQVLSGDRESIRLAFNLMAVADGGFAEELTIMLGSLIRINPKLFLEGLSEFQVLIGRIDALVGNLGDFFVDRLEAQCYENQLRIDSLSGVKDPSLHVVKDRCVKSLRDHMNKYCKKI